MGSAWFIEPHYGIGRLQFGLTPEEIAAVAPVYGTPSSLITGSTAVADVEAMIAELGVILSEDDISAMCQATEGQSGIDRQNLEMNRTPILLEYQSGRLAGVTVEARHDETQFRGERVFSLEALEVLQLFEHANGGPGRFRSNEAAYDNLAVSLYAFSEVLAEGEVRAATQADPDFRARSVTVRREPYRPSDELDQFVTVSFE